MKECVENEGMKTGGKRRPWPARAGFQISALGDAGDTDLVGLRKVFDFDFDS
jgi:hypothetical protein